MTDAVCGELPVSPPNSGVCRKAQNKLDTASAAI
jgi:hypothetical protein